MTDDIQLTDVQAALNEVTSIWSSWVPASAPVVEQPKVVEEQKQTVESNAQVAEEVSDKPKSSTSNRRAKILHEKNAAISDAEQAKQEKAELAQQLAEAQKTIQELSSQEVDEDNAREHDLKIVDAISKKNSIESDLKRSSKDEQKDFYRNVPEAVAIKDKIDDILKQHPTLSPYQALALHAGLSGEPVETVDDQKEHKKENYDLLGTSNAWSSTKGDLSDFSTMSGQDMKEALRKQIMSGDLAL